MGFIRSLNEKDLEALKGEPKFSRLLRDVEVGIVFPAVRDNALDFYYKGGRLYHFENKRFERDKSYNKENYQPPKKIEDEYELHKEQNNLRFGGGGNISERQFLDKLNKYTFAKGEGFGHSPVVVLDVEICLNPNKSREKCDMALLHIAKQQLMFVEGKIFSDRRMKDRKPDGKIGAVAQVRGYSEIIMETASEICKQYKNHIELVNKLFATTYPTDVTLCDTNAKLLVYGTPTKVDLENKYIYRIRKESYKEINSVLGTGNVMWNEGEEEPSLEEIWNYFSQPL